MTAILKESQTMTDDSAQAQELLEDLRARIDTLDTELVALLKQRMDLVDQVIARKTAHGLPSRLPGRIAEVIDRAEVRGRDLGLPTGFAAAIYTVIVEETCRFEEEFLPEDKSSG